MTDGAENHYVMLMSSTAFNNSGQVSLQHLQALTQQLPLNKQNRDSSLNTTLCCSVI